MSSAHPPALIPRAKLFANPTKAHPRISPDGELLAWLAPREGALNIWVAPVTGSEEPRVLTDDRKGNIATFVWTYADNTLLYLQDTDGNEEYHVYILDVLTGFSRDLTPFEGVRAMVSAVSAKNRDHVLIAMNQRDPAYFDIYSLELATGSLSIVEQNTDFGGFLVDEHYRVCVATKLSNDGSLGVYHRDGQEWRELFCFLREDASVSGPVAINAEGTALFMNDSRGRNTAALVRMDLASGTTKVLAANTHADIGDLILDWATWEPLAYSYVLGRQVHVGLAPEIQADLDFLESNRLGEWQLINRVAEDRLWVIASASDVEPRAAHLYDRQARTLSKLFDFRPELIDAPLVQMKPVAIRSRDGLNLVAYLSRPLDCTDRGPLVLSVHGGPWGRDTFGFNIEHQWLANRGYSVLSVNFRGSTGFGKSFVNASDREWGRAMDDDLLDAVAWAINEGIADPDRIAIIGTSYGGYAVLSSITRNPDVFACGVDIVGPSNLETLLATIPPYWAGFRQRFIQALGDPATDEGRALLRERSPVHFADRIKKPLLIGQGANDPRVKQAESDQMVDAMKSKGVPVAYVLYPDEGHGFSKPENQMSFTAITEAFLARHLGGRAEPINQDELAKSSLQIIEGAALLGEIGSSNSDHASDSPSAMS